MTLFNQINSLLFGLFLLVMSSLLYFQFTETKAFMVNQMESDLNNTSTSLSLMLKPHLQTGDEAVVDTLVNVIFEGGFYQQVELTWLADNKKQVWNSPVLIDDVPQWFIDLTPFEAKSKETIITSGWLQLAKLTIKSNPAMGYRELWRAMNDTAMILSALFLLSVLLLHIRLKIILKPLYDVSVHAKEIAQRKFSPDMLLPKTSELRDVVGAVNSMSGQLKQVFKALDDEVSTLKNDKLLDPVSQLPNRSCLTGQLNSWLAQPGFGGLLLANFDWLEEIHSQFGYQLRDKTIKIFASKLQENLPKNDDSIIARISNTEFAFLVSSSEHEQVMEYVQMLIRLVNQEIINAGYEPNRGFAIGITERNCDGVTRAEFLAQADNALQQAINTNKLSSWFQIDTQQEFSREEWRSRLSFAITNNQFLFQWQPVHTTLGDTIMQREVYCRLKIDDKVVSASEFMPFVERLSLGAQLDRCLLESIVNQKILEFNTEPVAVNLTRDSLSDLEFQQWLAKYLGELTHPEKLYFEIHEAGVTHDLQACIGLAAIIEKSGAKFGIDNCGRQMGSLNYLQQMKPHYIKLDLSLSYYNNEDEDHQQNLELCRALVNIARGFDIKVIVTGIENENYLQAFKLLRTDGYQGYINPPVDILNSKI